MAYRADIEIGVKGARYLDELQNKLTQVSKAIDAVNAKDVVVRRTIAGAASATPMGPGGAGVTSASATAAATAVENKVRAMRREETQQGIKSVRDRAVAENYISGIIEKRLQAKQKELEIEQQITRESNKQAASAFKSRAGGAVSSAIIGGGFPLLFGQGAGAAVGGGVGGLAGGLLGGGFGFALSIAGTALGDVVDQTQTFNRSLAVLNASTKQYGATAEITANDVKKLATNLNITKEEAIDVLSAFSGFRSAETKNALALLYGTDASTLQDLAAVKDKAGLAQVILKSYNKITIETATQLLNQLKTTDSATVELAFQKALLEVEIRKTEQGLRQITIQDRLIAGLASIGSLGGGGPVIDPAIFGQERVKQFRQQNKPQDLLNNALKALQQLRGATRTAEGFRPDRGADKAARDAAKEAERVAEVVRNRRANAEYIRIESGLQDKIAAAENNRDTVLAARLRGEQAILNIQYEYAKSLADEKNPAAQAAIIYEGMTKITASRRDTEREINRIYLERKRMMEDMITDLDYEVKLKYATTQEERTRIEIERERARLLKEGITDENLLAAVAARRAELDKPVLGADLVRQQIGSLSDEITKLIDVGTQITAVAEGIGSAFANSFKGVISGALTAQEALSSFFQSVADRFLDMAAQIIAKWIEMTILNSILNLFPGGGGGGGASMFTPNFAAFEFVPGRASGGPVMAGSPYIVGERGPELFVPGRSGGIVPNNSSFGTGSTSVVVNVDASGSNVQGDGSQANQLGKAIGIAVQQELIKQKRPGGLLA